MTKKKRASYNYYCTITITLTFSGSNMHTSGPEFTLLEPAERFIRIKLY